MSGKNDLNGNSVRAWQRMLSGRRLDLLDPSPLDVELEDIAHGLARVARWNGQTNGDHAFSVAQHSLLVEQVMGLLNASLSAQHKLFALLHDAPEYVIGDMISPFKAVVGGAYKDVENRLEAAIHLRVGLPAHPDAKLKKAIKNADKIVAYFEATELAGFDTSEAAKFFGRPNGITAAQLNLVPMPTKDAQTLFVERLHTVMAEL
ncbi:MAG: HD family hydrolase [Rhizobiaceae bacterium]|nr:HD family hydrolase [Hyphomicrobiales bacterium]NRB31339.1 HD family hydrolase [Rhizobiaceae bacterium]